MKKPLKKKSRQIAKKPRARADQWVCVGADVSTYSIALAGIHKTPDGKIKAKAVAKRWERGTDYFTRMAEAAKAHELVHDLLGELGAIVELDQVFFACEEPISFGHLQRKESQTIKQQCQISGSFLGSLLRWGWVNIYEIQANAWRKVVADDLAAHHGIDFTTYSGKYNSLDVLPLPEGMRPSAKTVGKYRSQQWVAEIHPKWDGNWPDTIQHYKRGLISRPPESRAQGVQPDDRYDAFPMAEWVRREIRKSKS
jgi:hypothetical protein